MKQLELNEMESLEGGDCGTLFGIAAGVAIGGLIVATGGLATLGGVFYLAGGAGIWSTGVFCED